MLEVLVFLFTLASGLIIIDPMFAVPSAVVGCLLIVHCLMKAADVRTQEMLLKEATAKYQAIAQREFDIRRYINQL